MRNKEISTQQFFFSSWNLLYKQVNPVSIVLCVDVSYFICSVSKVQTANDDVQTNTEKDKTNTKGHE